jgi:hypothetical protein
MVVSLLSVGMVEVGVYNGRTILYFTAILKGYFGSLRVLAVGDQRPHSGYALRKSFGADNIVRQ